MDVRGLNGRDYKINLQKYIVRGNDPRKRSKPHMKAREILNKQYSGYNVYEEVKLPGTVDPSKKSALFIDFFIERFRIAIEVNGMQHYKYIQFFHGDATGFRNSKRRDVTKEQWCELNEIELIVLKDSEIKLWGYQLGYKGEI